MNGSSRFRAVILAAASALLFASVASADKPTDKKHKPKQIPDTGVELVPSDPAGEAALEQMTSRSSEGLTLVTHDNGMLSVDLEGRFMNVMVATPNADGTRTFSCLTGSHASKQAAAGAQAVQAWRAQAKAQTAQANASHPEEK